MKLLFILLLGLGFSQTEVSQKVIEINDVQDGTIINISQLFPDYNLEWAIINILECSHDYDCALNNYTSGGNGVHTMYDSASRSYYHNSFNASFYAGTFDFLIETSSPQIFNIKLLVTAPFPEEDTGYIEEGYQFCVQPGANLLSFPCDNPISVNQSLPQGTENFITQIVGQGVAATYNPALGWVGSLDNFSPGSGYWFKSNESLCFEYDCVED